MSGTLISRMYGGALKPRDPRRYILEAMVGAMQADGEVDNDEMAALERNLQEHELFAGMRRDVVQELIEMANEAIKYAGGANRRVEYIANGLPARTHRLVGYAAACEIAYTNGENSAERVYLEGLRMALNITDEEAGGLQKAAKRNQGIIEAEDRASAMRLLAPRFVDCMCVMALADQVVTEKERGAMLAILRNVADMGVLEEAEIQDALNQTLRRLDETDPEGELRVIAKAMTNASDRYWATIYTMIVSIADGHAEWRRVPTLTMMQRHFGLKDYEMDKANQMAVLMYQPIKNRGSLT